MSYPKIVSRQEWLNARKILLAQEKEFTRQRDALSAQRRRLPMVKIDKDYIFDGPEGQVRLADLFDGRRQLIIYHFMFEPGSPPPGRSGEPWDEGCSGCSFVADNIGHLSHLHARDTSLVLVSRAPLAKIIPFRERMGWTLPWYSSFGRPPPRGVPETPRGHLNHQRSGLRKCGQFPASRRKTLFGETPNPTREDAYAPQTRRRYTGAPTGRPRPLPSRSSRWGRSYNLNVRAGSLRSWPRLRTWSIAPANEPRFLAISPPIGPDREMYEGAFYYMIARGDCREVIVRTTRIERTLCARWPKRVRRSGLRVHGFALMQLI